MINSECFFSHDRASLLKPSLCLFCLNSSHSVINSAIPRNPPIPTPIPTSRLDEVRDGTGVVMVPVDDTAAEVVTVIVPGVKSSGSTNPEMRLKITDPS